MNSLSPTDAERIKHGQITAIFKKYNAQLRGFINKRIVSEEDAEDILQNVFYQLSKIDLIEHPIEHISAWLYSVAGNQIIDRSRKKREERLPGMVSDSEDSYLPYDISDDTSTPEKEFLKTMVWEELELSLKELPDEQRSVFELTELQGISFKEIAEATGIPVNTPISRKRYAVQHLRKRLDILYKDLLEP